MAEIIRLRKSPHDEVQELLPWFVNGTLAPEEVERVEAHLADCAECQVELSAERKLASALSTIPLDCESRWERMEERLNAESQARFGAMGHRMVGGLWRKRVPLGWAVASPIAAAAALTLMIVSVAPKPPSEPVYRALGAAETIQPANLVVQFEPTTRVRDMQGLLQSVNARLVDGPTATGAYLLRVDQSKRELALKHLRDNQAIALAEPIDGPVRE